MEKLKAYKMLPQGKRKITYEFSELLRCDGCRYWKPNHVKENDGSERAYREGEIDVLGIPSVTTSVGINIGARCYVDFNCGYGNEPVCRLNFEYCSRAEPLPEGMTYPKWWGWKDGDN